MYCFEPDIIEQCASEGCLKWWWQMSKYFMGTVRILTGKHLLSL